MKKKESHILAIDKRAGHLACNGKNGFLPFDINASSLPFVDADLWIGPRSHLEQMETFLQIIPYVITVRDGKILSYQRTKSGGESRLHDNFSIGFGGHIDIGDVVPVEGGASINLEATINNAVNRELSEELSIANEIPDLIPYGLLLDESNEVGRVHIGIVMIANVTGMVTSKEDQIDLQGFKTPEELSELNLENWSRIIVDVIKSVPEDVELPQQEEIA